MSEISPHVSTAPISQENVSASHIPQAPASSCSYTIPAVKLGILASAIGLIQHVIRKVEMPILNKTLANSGIDLYWSYWTHKIARENLVSQHTAKSFIDFVRNLAEKTGYKGWMSPSLVRQLATEYIKEFNLIASSDAVGASRSWGWEMKSKVDLLAGITKMIENSRNSLFFKSGSFIRQSGAGIAAGFAGVATYLKVAGGTVVASTTAGTAAMLGLGSVLGIALGAGWHYSGLGKITGSDKIDYALGEWLYYKVNPEQLEMRPVKS